MISKKKMNLFILFSLLFISLTVFQNCGQYVKVNETELSSNAADAAAVPSLPAAQVPNVISCSVGFEPKNGVCTKIPNITKVVAGIFQTCAIYKGALKCWGLNHRGQLGDGTLTNRNYPVEIFSAGVTDVTVTQSGDAATSLDITASSATCAVVNGALKCWGGSYGSGGHKTIFESGVTKVAMSGNSACAIKDGEVFCWGHRYSSNSLTTPRKVLSQAIHLTSNNYDYCADTGKEVVCWDGMTGLSEVPVTVLKEPVKFISGGLYSICAANLKNELICFGQSPFGSNSLPIYNQELLVGLNLYSHPRKYDDNVDYFEPPNGLGAIAGFMIQNGELVFINQIKYPIQKTILRQFSMTTSVSVGVDHACVIKNDNLYCFGFRSYSGYSTLTKTNEYGQLGYGLPAPLLTNDLVGLAPIESYRVNLDR